MLENMLQAKKDFSRFGLSLFVIGIVTTVLQLILGVIMGIFMADTTLANSDLIFWILTMAPLYLVSVPIGYWMMSKIPAEDCPKQKLRLGRFLLLMLMCMPIMYAGNLIGNILSSLLSGGTAENPLIDLIMDKPLYSFFFAVLLAPFVEEFLFRRQIIDRLGKYGEKTAILFSGITFGLFHMNLFQFFYAFGLGVIFAYVYTRTRMLRYPVIMHMIINFLGSVIAPLLLNMLDLELLTSLDSANAEQLMDALPGLLVYLGYSLLYMGCVIAGLAILIVRWKKCSFHPASRELPAGNVGKYVYRNPGMICFTLFCLVMIVLALF